MTLFDKLRSAGASLLSYTASSSPSRVGPSAGDSDQLDPEREQWVLGRRKFFFGMGGVVLASAMPTIEMAKAITEARVNPEVARPGDILLRKSMVTMTHQEGGRRWETAWKRLDTGGGSFIYVPEEA